MDKNSNIMKILLHLKYTTHTFLIIYKLTSFNDHLYCFYYYRSSKDNIYKDKISIITIIPKVNIDLI